MSYVWICNDGDGEKCARYFVSFQVGPASVLPFCSEAPCSWYGLEVSTHGCSLLGVAIVDISPFCSVFFF